MLGLAGPGGLARQYRYNPAGLAGLGRGKRVHRADLLLREPGLRRRTVLRRPGRPAGQFPALRPRLYLAARVPSGRQAARRAVRPGARIQHRDGHADQLQYDGNGNLLSADDGGTSRVFEYEPGTNRLHAISPGTGQYDYDPTGRVIATPDLRRAAGDRPRDRPDDLGHGSR